MMSVFLQLLWGAGCFVSVDVKHYRRDLYTLLR